MYTKRKGTRKIEKIYIKVYKMLDGLAASPDLYAGGKKLPGWREVEFLFYRINFVPHKRGNK